VKEIQEIITDTKNISQEQVATDLSKEEKDELIGLINVSKATTLQANGDISFCATPTPSPIPTCSPNNACSSESFCCVVSFSSGLSVPTTAAGVPQEIHAAVVPKDLSIESDGQCTTRIGNCVINLNKGTINGSAEIFVSLGVKDQCGNCSFVSCSDFVCLSEKDIICCILPDEDKVKFIVDDLDAQFLTFACDESQQVWQITGTISFTCEECI
jgi:hypothetical protein